MLTLSASYRQAGSQLTSSARSPALPKRRCHASDPFLPLSLSPYDGWRSRIGSAPRQLVGTSRLLVGHHGRTVRANKLRRPPPLPPPEAGLGDITVALPTVSSSSCRRRWAWHAALLLLSPDINSALARPSRTSKGLLPSPDTACGARTPSHTVPGRLKYSVAALPNQRRRKKGSLGWPCALHTHTGAV